MTFLSPVVTLCDSVLNSKGVQSHHFQLLLFVINACLYCLPFVPAAVVIISYSYNILVMNRFFVALGFLFLFFHSFTGETL